MKTKEQALEFAESEILKHTPAKSFADIYRQTAAAEFIVSPHNIPAEGCGCKYCFWERMNDRPIEEVLPDEA